MAAKEWVSGTEQEYMEWCMEQVRSRLSAPVKVEDAGSGVVYDNYHGEMPEDEG